jgi:hypothetical protein
VEIYRAPNPEGLVSVVDATYKRSPSGAKSIANRRPAAIAPAWAHVVPPSVDRNSPPLAPPTAANTAGADANATGALSTVSGPAPASRLQVPVKLPASVSPAAKLPVNVSVVPAPLLKLPPTQVRSLAGAPSRFGTVPEQV